MHGMEWKTALFKTSLTIGAGISIRDVPDIRFRFLLAGYPAVFFYPVPAPVPAEMVPGTGYLYRIVLGRFRQLVDAADCRHIMAIL